MEWVRWDEFLGDNPGIKPDRIQGPLSVEWEDCGIDKKHYVREASEFAKKIDFAFSNTIFDSAFRKE